MFFTKSTGYSLFFIQFVTTIYVRCYRQCSLVLVLTLGLSGALRRKGAPPLPRKIHYTQAKVPADIGRPARSSYCRPRVICASLEKLARPLCYRSACKHVTPPRRNIFQTKRATFNGKEHQHFKTKIKARHRAGPAEVPADNYVVSSQKYGGRSIAEGERSASSSPPRRNFTQWMIGFHLLRQCVEAWVLLRNSYLRPDSPLRPTRSTFNVRSDLRVDKAIASNTTRPAHGTFHSEEDLCDNTRREAKRRGMGSVRVRDIRSFAGSATTVEGSSCFDAGSGSSRK